MTIPQSWFYTASICYVSLDCVTRPLLTAETTSLTFCTTSWLCSVTVEKEKKVEKKYDFKLGRAMNYFTQTHMQNKLDLGKSVEGSAALRMRKCHILWKTVQGGEDGVEV